MKTLYIEKVGYIIYIKREDGDLENNPNIKLFTHSDGMKIMAEIAIRFLEPEGYIEPKEKKP